MLRDFWEDYGLMPIALVGLVALLVLGIYAAVQSEHEWATFKAAHHCKVVGRISGDVVTSITSNGQIGVGMTPDKTGWQCDDGMTYWR